MVATRTLQPGDIILREKAAVVGPSLEQSKPICVGCSAPLTRWVMVGLFLEGGSVIK